MEIYCHIATVTGWTFKIIDELDLNEISELYKYWNINPPQHLLMKAYIGYKSKDEKSNNENTEEFAKFLMNNFNGSQQKDESIGNRVRKI